MDKWQVVPEKSIGKIEFGMNREEVRTLLGDKYEEFKKSEFSVNTTDDYGFLHVYYSEDNRVEAVEVFEDVELVYDDNTIFPIQVSKIKEVLPGITEDEWGFTDEKRSVGYETDEESATSILVGREGYYRFDEEELSTGDNS